MLLHELVYNKLIHRPFGLFAALVDENVVRSDG
jgi:hypothetical protein